MALLKSMLLPLKKQIQPIERAPSNFLYALLKAEMKTQKGENAQQECDADMTEFSVQLEELIFQHWNRVLENDAKTVENAPENYKKNEKQYKKEGLTLQQLIEQDQAKYNSDNSEASSNQSQQDGAVQANQQQTSADATNLQMQVQMMPGITSIFDTLVNMLGRIIS